LLHDNTASIGSKPKTRPDKLS